MYFACNCPMLMDLCCIHTCVGRGKNVVLALRSTKLNPWNCYFHLQQKLVLFSMGHKTVEMFGNFPAAQMTSLLAHSNENCSTFVGLRFHAWTMDAEWKWIGTRKEEWNWILFRQTQSERKNSIIWSRKTIIYCKNRTQCQQWIDFAWTESGNSACQLRTAVAIQYHRSNIRSMGCDIILGVERLHNVRCCRKGKCYAFRISNIGICSWCCVEYEIIPLASFHFISTAPATEDDNDDVNLSMTLSMRLSHNSFNSLDISLLRRIYIVHFPHSACVISSYHKQLNCRDGRRKREREKKIHIELWVSRLNK